MSHYRARRKSFILLLLVLILILGVCCLTTYDSSVDLLVPVFLMLSAPLIACARLKQAPDRCASSAPGPYFPAAPDRAPPA